MTCICRHVQPPQQLWDSFRQANHLFIHCKPPTRHIASKQLKRALPCLSPKSVAAHVRMTLAQEAGGCTTAVPRVVCYTLLRGVTRVSRPELGTCLAWRRSGVRRLQRCRRGRRGRHSRWQLLLAALIGRQRQALCEEACRQQGRQQADQAQHHRQHHLRKGKPFISNHHVYGLKNKLKIYVEFFVQSRATPGRRRQPQQGHWDNWRAGC